MCKITSFLGVITHLWATAFHPILSDTLIRYYVDGEKNASIQFQLSMACGVGFDDQFNPWYVATSLVLLEFLLRFRARGTKWFGKGAADGSWFNNFRIPFQKSIRITYQKGSGRGDGFYMIIRGEIKASP